MNKSIILSLLFLSVIEISSQPNALPFFLKHSEQMLGNDGKWKALNPDYNPKDSTSIRYFGYTFTKGLHPNTIQIEINGYFPAFSEWITFWRGFYTWDAKNQKIVYHSVNNSGSVAEGIAGNISASDLTLEFTITSKEGKVEKHKDIHSFSSGQIKSNSFVLTKKKWTPKNSYIWTPLELPKGNISFMSTRDGNFEVYSMDMNGENVRNLTCNKATDYAFSYTPDNRLVFYSNRDGNDEIYIMDADGKKQTNLTNNPAADRITAVSPDGKQIVFSSYRDQNKADLYIMNIDGSDVRRLTNNYNFEDAPSWSPDGKSIIFSRDLKASFDTSTAIPSNGEIFSIDIDGTSENRLTNKPGFDGGPQYSPDGKKIAFYGTTPDKNYEILIMNADGSNVENLTNDPLEDYSPSWSPDGKWIAYTKGNSKNYDVWIINLETRIKTRLTTQPRRDESPFWKYSK